MAVERPFRVVARVDNRAVGALENDPVGLEQRPAVLTEKSMVSRCRVVSTSKRTSLIASPFP